MSHIYLWSKLCIGKERRWRKGSHRCLDIWGFFPSLSMEKEEEDGSAGHFYKSGFLSLYEEAPKIDVNFFPPPAPTPSSTKLLLLPSATGAFFFKTSLFRSGNLRNRGKGEGKGKESASEKSASSARCCFREKCISSFLSPLSPWQLQQGKRK